MNHTDSGKIAVGAHGSIARARSEAEISLEERGIKIDPTIIHMTAIEAFRTAYTQELEKELLAHPDEYAWPSSNIQIVVERMTKALYHGTAAMSNPLRRVSKRLGLNGSKRMLVMFVREALK